MAAKTNTEMVEEKGKGKASSLDIAPLTIPGSTGSIRVRIPGAHALRLISRVGKEGSTVSSITCDRRLILS